MLTQTTVPDSDSETSQVSNLRVDTLQMSACQEGNANEKSAADRRTFKINIIKCNTQLKTK